MYVNRCTTQTAKYQWRMVSSCHCLTPRYGFDQIECRRHLVKILYNGGDLTGHQMAEIAKLPFTGVLDGVVEFLKREKFIDTKAQTGSTGIGEASFRYTLTDKGVAKAKEAMERTSYASAAPVPLDMYLDSLRAQNTERPPHPPKTITGRDE